MNRRDFLSLSTAAALVPLDGGAWAAPGPPGRSGGQRLIVLLLRGAIDGLNVVVPYGEEAYYAARPTIAIAKPGAAEGGGLALDAHFALHPALAPLMKLWQAGQLAFIHAAGFPDPTRSHFDAQLFIENGTPGRRATADGWMNRLLAALPGSPDGAPGPTAALAIGATLPQILRGRLPLVAALEWDKPVDQAGAARGEPIDAGALETLLAPVLSKNTRVAVAAAPADLRPGLILGGPDFMRR